MKIDTSGVEAPRYEPLPAGEYLCNIDSAEVRETKNGAGRYVNVALDAILNDGSTRRVYDVLLFEHTSEKAVQIGTARLRSLGESIGQDAGDIDPDQMAGQRVIAKLKIDSRDTEQNQVAVYKPADKSAGATQQAQSTETAEPQQAKAPWNNVA
jgi:hypothetical protein